MWLLASASIVASIALISVSWSHRRGAPWAPTPLRKVRMMLEMASVGPGDVVYDLGCGDGRTIVTAARRYGAHAVGIEIDPLRYLWCQLLITVLGLRNRVRIVYGDFFSQDLSGADIVTCYLLQSTNEKIQEKFMRELHPHTRVVSYAFTFPSLHLVRSDRYADVYVYDLA